MKRLNKKILAGLALGGMVNFSGFSFNPAIVEGAESDVIRGGGGETFTGSVTDERVQFNSGTFTGIFGGMTASGGVGNNTVYFDGGEVTGGIVGGFTFYYDGLHAGDVWDNKVFINGGSVNYVSGGEVGRFSTVTNYSNLTGGNVYNNTVVMNGGTVTGGIIGGSALVGSAVNNTVEIRGGTVSGDVIGGEVQQPVSTSQASNNTISIYGSPNLSGATLYGGRLGGTTGSAKGNILNVYTSGISVGSIDPSSFDRFNFYTPNYVRNGDTILSLGTRTENFSLDKFSFSPAGDSSLTTGDTVNLIVNGISSDVARNVTISKGLLWDYAGVISSGENGITATIGDRIGPNSDNDGGIVNAREDQIAHLQINPPDPFSQPMTESLLLDEDDPDFDEIVKSLTGYNIFLNTGGGKLKTKTGGGNYIRSSRGNFDLGFARSLDSQAGKLYIAPVFEHVTGHYNALLPSNKYGEVHGHGTTKYNAGGFILRQMNNAGYYFEGSFRGGQVENSFSSNDFVRSNNKVHGEYTTKAPVFTGHVRIGQAKRLNANNVLDLYGTYFYTRQNGDDADIYSDNSVDRVSFNAVTNHTLRLGYRLTTRTSRISRVYTGLAYQYDRSSDSTVTAGDGYSRTADGVKGSSGMLELGWQIKPNKNNMWLVDINATGWIGHHQGFNFMAKMQKSF